MAEGRNLAGPCAAFSDHRARRDRDPSLLPPYLIADAGLGRTRNSVASPTP